MLIAISALKGYAVTAADVRKVGTVADILFDDRTWAIRWIVVDVGSWLIERRVLFHPASIRRRDHVQEVLHLALTKAQIEGAPSIAMHAPVSARMETGLFDYYGVDPLWGSGYFGIGDLGAPCPGPGHIGAGADSKLPGPEPRRDYGDPHLRSFAEVTGYPLHATDGLIGHAENFLVDDETWDVRYIIVDTKNWWPGDHVLISPYAVRSISWSDGEIRLNVPCERVKTSPHWDPIAMIDQVYEKTLHGHYGWNGYGF